MMDSSFESDSDQNTTTNSRLDNIITETQANSNHNEAGDFVSADDDQIRMVDHDHLTDPTVATLIEKVVEEVQLPYRLADFQQVSMNILLQKKDLILLSPTGSGKES